MNPETERLRAEVAAARTSLVRSVRGIRDWAADPFSVKEHVHEHPWITLGAVVGAGVLVGQMLVRRKRAERDERGRKDWIDRLLDTAVRNAQPIVTDVVKEWLGEDGQDAAVAEEVAAS